MTNPHSDALVFFGATGDLAYKKIFPALQAMLKRGHLDVPVIGVAKAGWNLEQLRARAHDSLEKHGGVDAAAFDKLSGLLRYVDGDHMNIICMGGGRTVGPLVAWDLVETFLGGRVQSSRASLASSGQSGVARAEDGDHEVALSGGRAHHILGEGHLPGGD
jgi:hypothetical protein